MTITASEFKAACRDLIAEAQKYKPEALIQYAATYARSGLALTDPEAMRVQCLYINNNLYGWRGTVAREAKAIFREGTKGILRTVSRPASYGPWVFTWQVIGSDIFEQPIAGYQLDKNGCLLALQQALDFWGLQWDQIELLHVEKGGECMVVI